jgi:putative flippase GtrA
MQLDEMMRLYLFSRKKMPIKYSPYYGSYTFAVSVAITNEFDTFHNWTFTDFSTESVLHNHQPSIVCIS